MSLESELSPPQGASPTGGASHPALPAGPAPGEPDTLILEITLNSCLKLHFIPPRVTLQPLA